MKNFTIGELIDWVERMTTSMIESGRYDVLDVDKAIAMTGLLKEYALLMHTMDGVDLEPLGRGLVYVSKKT